GAAARERFRPIIERLLVLVWRGEVIVPLGAHACAWFARYLDEDPWRREDRFSCELPLRLTARWRGREASREVILAPLPHPSPASARWAGRFAGLAAARLARWPPRG